MRYAGRWVIRSHFLQLEKEVWRSGNKRAAAIKTIAGGKREVKTTGCRFVPG